MDEIFNISNLNTFFKQYPQKSNKISPFIDEGVFLTHKPPINHNYTIDNFEYVTDYSKEAITIGRGGYGKLYLARNKKDKYVWNDAVSSGYLVDLQDIVLRLEKKNVLNNVLTVTKTGSIQKSNIEYCSDTDIYSVSDKIKQLINIYDTHIISVESMLR